MPWPKPQNPGGQPKLTPIQIQHLKRIAGGGDFTGSVPELRLLSMGLIRVAQVELTVQGLIVVAKL